VESAETLGDHGATLPRMVAVLGGYEVALVVAVIVLMFGSSQLPKLARSLGQAQRELKNGMDDGAEDDADVAS